MSGSTRQTHSAQGGDMHTERLAGRTQQIFFQAAAAESCLFPDAPEVDAEKSAQIDAQNLESPAVNQEIRRLIAEGYGDIRVLNPGAKHSLGVGILNRLELRFEGSLGYFGCGLVDGPNIRISGRVGWSCAENMMAGTVVVEKNAGSTFGAALRGGDLVCRGDVGSRTGINIKGGTIIVGGRSGIFSGFMMQRGRMIILGDAGTNLGDSMYDGTIYVGGEIDSLGIDAVLADLTDIDVDWLTHKLALYDLEAPDGIENLKKVVAGRQLWNYDNLDPIEKKIIL